MERKASVVPKRNIHLKDAQTLEAGVALKRDEFWSDGVTENYTTEA